MNTLFKFKDPGQKKEPFKGILIENTNYSSISEFKLVQYYINEYGTYDSKELGELFVGPQPSLKIYIKKLEDEIKCRGYNLTDVFIDEYTKNFILTLFN